MLSITKHTKGSNQHRAQRSNLRSLLFIMLFSISIIFVFIIRFSNNNIISAHISSKDVYAMDIPSPTPTHTQEPVKASELEEIVAYVTRIFEPEGKDVVVEAIRCFYSESGLRVNAYNFNTNGTGDYSVAQVNDIHVARYGDEFKTDWKANIDIAYKIYQDRGWDAWYGKDCN